MHSQVDGWCLKPGLAGTWRDEHPGHREGTVPSPQVTLLEARNGPVTGVTLWALLTHFLISFKALFIIRFLLKNLKPFDKQFVLDGFTTKLRSILSQGTVIPSYFCVFFLKNALSFFSKACAIRRGD